MKWLSDLVDTASDFFAHRKGLLPLIGMGLIILNLLLQIIPLGWLSTSNLLLHIGLLIAIFGFMLAWAL
jgi:hypothetical protein